MKKILVVDDEAGLVDALSEILTEEGFLVHWARNGADALHQIDEDPPDVILLDWMMPVMDGKEMMRRLRANPTRRDLSVIMMTSVPETAVRQDCDVDGYLAKPFQLDALLVVLAATLKNPRRPK